MCIMSKMLFTNIRYYASIRTDDKQNIQKIAEQLVFLWGKTTKREEEGCTKTEL